MSTKHPDSEILDLIGTTVVRLHFDVTRQAIQYWRRQGVPEELRAEFAKLARKAGHVGKIPPRKQFSTERKKRGPVPTSSAQPA